jgi:hypothetical protein
MSIILLLLGFSFASMNHIPDGEAPSWRYHLPAPLIDEVDEGAMREPWELMLSVGPRNLEWLKLLNANLPDGQKIDLYPPGTSKGIPIEEPLKYNAAILNERLRVLQTEMPATLKEIIFGQNALPTSLPVDLETYKTWAKKTDSAYSLGLRWRMMQPYISYYRQNKVNDFRGLHYLKKAEIDGTVVPVAQLKVWVRDVCANAKQALDPCDRELVKVANRTELLQIFAKYRPQSQAAYDEFFSVQVQRPDVKILSPLSLVMPFRTHANPIINDYVKSNIEDEFKWVGGFLNIVITPTAAANVVFLPAVTPHVDSLGGDNITMSSEVPLASWDTMYTMRHEFGHVLGFPDCYMEFYDDTESAFVNYQFDVKNLMCSRAGRFNAVNEAALKKAYGL